MRHNITIAVLAIAAVGGLVLLVLRWTRGIALAGDAEGAPEPTPDHTHEGATLRLTLHGMEWTTPEEGSS